MGLDFTKDHFLQGTCDDGFVTLATALGWLDDLYRYREQMCDASVAVLDNAMINQSSSSPTVPQKDGNKVVEEEEQNNKRSQNETRSSL